LPGRATLPTFAGFRVQDLGRGARVYTRALAACLLIAALRTASALLRVADLALGQIAFVAGAVDAKLAVEHVTASTIVARLVARRRFTNGDAAYLSNALPARRASGLPISATTCRGITGCASITGYAPTVTANLLPRAVRPRRQLIAVREILDHLVKRYGVTRSITTKKFWSSKTSTT